MRNKAIIASGLLAALALAAWLELSGPSPARADAEARFRAAQHAAELEKRQRRRQISDLAEATGLSFQDAARLRLEWLAYKRLGGEADSLHMADVLGIMPGKVAR